MDAEPDDVRVEHALGLHTGLVPGVESVQLLPGLYLHYVAPGGLADLLRLGLGDPGVLHQLVAAGVQLSPALGTPGVPGAALATHAPVAAPRHVNTRAVNLRIWHFWLMIGN